VAGFTFEAMSKAAEYRANAAECERMAGLARKPEDKALWLQMAEHWLRMIPKPKQSDFEAFDIEEKSRGTRQTPSDKDQHAFRQTPTARCATLMASSAWLCPRRRWLRVR
jgi:hypothetical protein